jgi:hypothetical protein
LSARSELSVHTPVLVRYAWVDVSMKWPAVIAGNDVVPSQIPPEARMLKVLAAGEVASRVVPSPHTNEPSLVAFACVPAAKLPIPPAVFLKPPGTAESRPLAVFWRPPATAEVLPLSVLLPPAATADRAPLAVFR